MNNVIIYTSTYCGYCFAAKLVFEKKGIDYKEINLSKNPSLRKEIMGKWNWRTVPLIIINDKFVGGFRELTSLESSNKLDKFLN